MRTSGHHERRLVRRNTTLRLGLRANWRQFWLLVAINAFVGAMVGLERTVLPLIAQRDFGIVSRSATLSFIATFGLVKALTNPLAGRLGDRFGRKPVLVAGWLFGAPMPFLVIWAPAWSWIVAANVLLGLNQGLAWSTTVVMKIDLVGPERRGLAMGLNECAGYLAVALSALASGLIAERVGLRPEPFYLGLAFVALGLGLSVAFVRETKPYARLEAARPSTDSVVSRAHDTHETVWDLIRRTAGRDRTLFTACQAGLVNNLNDGLAWGLFPIFFAAAGLSLGKIGVLAFVYPATWGIAQLGTGAWSDRVGRKWLIAGGMALQGLALLAMVVATGFAWWVVCGIALGLGTAMVYPTLLASIGDVAHPSWRGTAIGVYRMWRDLGYAVGAVLAGAVADAFGIPWSIASVGVITLASGVLVAARMPETLRVASQHTL
ncbi:MAG TPA: MFS transporter [Gemmatimonadaceae bacterium]